MSICEVSDGIVDRVVDQLMNGPDTTGIMRTGYIDLDHRLGGGLLPGRVYLIGGRPAMGKTSFLCNIASKVCIKNGNKVVYCSKKLNSAELVKRLLQLESHVHIRGLLNKCEDVSSEGWDEIIESAKVIGSSNLVIEDTPDLSIEALFDRMENCDAYKGVRLLIIDDVQKMRADKSVEGNTTDYVICKLKELAVNYNVAIFVSSSVERVVDIWRDHRPSLGDLCDISNSVEQVDYVMMLYRDQYYNRETELKNIAEIIISKSIDNCLGTIKLVWIPDIQLFGNIVKDFQSEGYDEGNKSSYDDFITQSNLYVVHGPEKSGKTDFLINVLFDFLANEAIDNIMFIHNMPLSDEQEYLLDGEGIYRYRANEDTSALAEIITLQARFTNENEGLSLMIVDDFEELIRYQSIEHIGMSKEEIIKYLIIKFKTMSDAFDIPVVICLKDETLKTTESYIKEYAHRVKTIQ